MPRPSLADASTSQPKLPGTERSPATNTPFVVRCRDVRIGSPGAKHVYLTLATWCESYVGDADHGTCWPSLRTVQTATEYGRTAFKEHYQFLLNQRFVTSQKGAPGKSSKKTIWTPDAAMRRRSEGSDSDPSRGVGFRPPKDQRRSEVRTPSNAAATTEDRKQQQRRFEGLVAYISHRHRELSRKRRPAPSPWDEAAVRADFDAGNVGIEELQDLADVLRDGRIPGEVLVRAADLQLDTEPCDTGAEVDKMTDTELRAEVADFAERNLEGAERDAVLAANDFYVVTESFPRPVAALPEPLPQVGVDSGGHVEWLSLPGNAA